MSSCTQVTHPPTADWNPWKCRACLRLLIVGDSREEVERLQRVLREGGITSSAVAVGTVATLGAALESASWDVVIANLDCSTCSALDVLALIESRGLDIPLIVTASASPLAVVVATLHAGACDYIDKQEYARLVPAIEREVRAAAGRQARRQAGGDLRRNEYLSQTLVEDLPVRVVVLRRAGTGRHCKRGGVCDPWRDQTLLGKTTLEPGWGLVAADGRPLSPADLPLSRALATGKAVRDLVVGIDHPTSGVRGMGTGARRPAPRAGWHPGGRDRHLHRYHRAQAAGSAVAGAAAGCGRAGRDRHQPRGHRSGIGTKLPKRSTGGITAEALGRNVMLITPPEASVGQAEAIMEELRAGRKWSGEFTVQRRDGSTFPALVTDSPIVDEGGC